MYNLPPNDERLLSLHENEVMEQLLLAMAFEDYREQQKDSADEQEEETIVRGSQKRVKILRDEKAKKLADTPKITGNSWYDEMERAETDPSKPLLKI